MNRLSHFRAPLASPLAAWPDMSDSQAGRVAGGYDAVGGLGSLGLR